MAVVTICSDFGAQENSLSLFPLFPYLFVMKWCDWMPRSLFFECLVLSQLVHSSLSLSSKGSSVTLHFFAIRVVSSAYLRLLIFLPAILIPVCASSSPAFCMMYSAYKLNKQDDNIQPWRFPIWNQSVVPSPVRYVASWPAPRFLRRPVRDHIYHSFQLTAPREGPGHMQKHEVQQVPSIKKTKVSTFLVVQWLRIWLTTQGTQVRSLVQEDSTCHRGA